MYYGYIVKSNEEKKHILYVLVGGWTNPIWKIWVKIGSFESFPQDSGVNIKNDLSCHHPENMLFLLSRFHKKNYKTWRVLVIQGFGRPLAELYITPGGWTNPIEKYESNWKSSPDRGENKKHLKPPPSYL